MTLKLEKMELLLVILKQIVVDFRDTTNDYYNIILYKKQHIKAIINILSISYIIMIIYIYK